MNKRFQCPVATLSELGVASVMAFGVVEKNGVMQEKWLRATMFWVAFENVLVRVSRRRGVM